MIARIVTMKFDENKIDEFLELFHTYKSKIRNFEGCTHLSLIQNIKTPNEISTFSHWVDENHLNKYRDSEIFKLIWPLTKTLFIEQPQAFSYEILTIA